MVTGGCRKTPIYIKERYKVHGAWCMASNPKEWKTKQYLVLPLDLKP